MPDGGWNVYRHAAEWGKSAFRRTFDNPNYLGGNINKIIRYIQGENVDTEYPMPEDTTYFWNSYRRAHGIGLDVDPEDIREEDLRPLSEHHPLAGLYEGEDERRFLEYRQNLRERGRVAVNQALFRLPSDNVKDFYQGSIDRQVADMIRDAVDGAEQDEGLKAAFYIEEPKFEELGYHRGERVFWVKADPMIDRYNTEYNVYDGDTLYFNTETIQDDGSSFRLADTDYDSVKDYIESVSDNQNYGRFGLRFLGIDAPEIPHYARIELDPAEMNIMHVDAEEMKDHDEYAPERYVWERHKPRSEGERVQLIRLPDSDTWNEYEVTEDRSPRDPVEIKMLVADGDEDYKAGLRARDTVRKLCMMGEVYLMIDTVTINWAHDRNHYPTKLDVDRYDDGPVNYLKMLIESAVNYNKYVKPPFGYYGQDIYGRHLGQVYVKLDASELRRRKLAGDLHPAESPDDEQLSKLDELGEIWVNLSKYLMAHHEEVVPAHEPLKDYTAEVFRLHTYDYRDRKYVDAVTDLAELDDRWEIQRRIFGRDVRKLRDWTVSIGDTTLMVPPSSIRCTTESSAERIPILRARGSMTKGPTRSNRIIELTLYFNREEGINGVPYDTTLPNGEPVTYYMNGLRSLVAQFKLTPFLPIENKYINEILNTEAVSLQRLQVSTLPEYPETLAATLVLQEFNYRVYMPEMPIMPKEPDEPYINPFATCINFEVMRWHYQRLIMAGEDVKDIDRSSLEFIEKTLDKRTPLMPVRVEDSGVKFYVANEEHLKERLQIKLAHMERGALNVPVIDDDATKDVVGRLAEVHETIFHDDTFRRYLDNFGYGLDLDGFFRVDLDLYPELGNNAVPGEMGLFWSPDKQDYEVHEGLDYEHYKNQMDHMVQALNDIDGVSARISPPADPETVTTVDLWGYTSERLAAEQVGDRDYGFEYKIRFFIEVRIDIENARQIEDLRVKAAGELEDETGYTHSDLFQDNRVFIPIVGSFIGHRPHYPSYEQHGYMPKGEKMDVDRKAPDVQFLNYCYRNRQRLSEDGRDIDEHAGQVKDAVDLESPDSIEFVEYVSVDSRFSDDYGGDTVRIANFSCQMSNMINEIGLNGIDSKGPQYLGGQDTAVELIIQTKDEDMVAMLNAMPRIAAQQARDYRLVLPVWPLRIESEITGLMGIHEVVVEHVDVQTIPQHPGYYGVTLRLVSVDRTLRNREALRKLETSQVAGYTGLDAAGELEMRSFFDLQDTLAQVELYPDLELPLIDELEEKKFYFIRHALRHRNETYPDPDFYFVYGHVLTSEIYRESILDILSQVHETYDNTYEDRSGASVNVGYTHGDHNPIEFEDGNAAYERQRQENQAIQPIVDGIKDDAAHRAEKHEERKTLQEEIPEALGLADTFPEQTWDVADQVKSVFVNRKDADSEYIENNLGKMQEALSDIDAILSRPIDLEVTMAENGMAEQDTIGDGGFLRFLATGDGRTLDFDKLSNALRAVLDNTMGGTLGDISEPIQQAFAKLVDFGFPDYSRPAHRIDFHQGADFFDFMFAAACAATGETYHEPDQQEEQAPEKWAPRMWEGPADHRYRGGGWRIPWMETDGGGRSLESDLAAARSFGIYGFKTYSRDDLVVICGRDEVSRMLDPHSDHPATGRRGGIEGRERFLIDPYYMTATDSEVMEYKKGCSVSAVYASVAALRLLLFWTKKMIEDRILPNPVVLAEETGIIDYIEGQTETPHMPDEMTAEEKGIIETLTEFYEDETVEAMKTGNLFPAFTMLATSDPYMYNAIKNRDYEKLQALVDNAAAMRGSESEGYAEFVSGQTETRVSKMIRALVGTGYIEHLEKVESAQITNPRQIFYSQVLTDIYLQAAADPKKYIPDSFFDMMVNDKRGRMARAFPTFYLLFIDEGREYGAWKLHDNFYNVSSVAEFTITKSRKIPADTAHVVMSNMFQTFTTEDEDMREEYSYNIRDVFDSIFSPRRLWAREEAMRRRAGDVTRARLMPGTRIHIRMGYGSNAATLPIVFNGSIAEVQAQEAVEFVAQGDGIELVNPMFESSLAHELVHDEEFFITRWFKRVMENGSTPQEILNSLLTHRGGWAQSVIRHILRGRVFNDNTFGITHFGEIDFDEVFPQGEVVQNIYEAGNPDEQAGGISQHYRTPDAPKISMMLFGKTFWDVLHVCASATPDYVAGIAPFGLRSTVFHGAPRYYYAYDYVLEDNIIKERRKPFQQYKIYSSYTDIISNQIEATERDMRTCAEGIYKRELTFSRYQENRVGPLWADINIYPEKQRTMVVDTSLKGQGVPVAGYFVPFMNFLMDELGAGDNYPAAVAWRMTASALRDSIKDMYHGELIVIGDPTVKPHDRMFLHDTYEIMEGNCLVESVVHNFSVQTGFTTSITPDAINVVDDKHEHAIQAISTGAVGRGLIASATVIGISAALARTPNAMLNLAERSTAKSISMYGRLARALPESTKTYLKGIPGVQRAAQWAAGRAAPGAAGSIAKGTAAGGWAVAGAGILLAAEIAIIAGFTAYAYEQFHRWMRNLKVIQIFPLKKNGVVYTAGTDGSKGLVVGSPTYDELGFIERLLDNIVSYQADQPFLNALRFIFVSEEMRNIVQRFKYDNNVTDIHGNPIESEEARQHTSRSMYERLLNNLEASKRHLIYPRALSHDGYYINSLEEARDMSGDLFYIADHDYIYELIKQGKLEILP